MRMPALTVAVLAAAAGCGFERATPYAGARVPDVAPWTDLGPLTVCTAAQARIVAPSLGTAGLCAQAGAGAACSRDADQIGRAHV